MRRLSSAFLTLWIIMFVPSLIVWGLIVRASDRGVDRFHSTWTWLEDKLAYPLVVAPLSNRAWRWLEDGTPVGATIGFLFLVGFWAAAIAAPLVLISGWWRWMGDRMAGNRDTTPLSYSDGFATTAIPIPGRVSTSPLAGLYVVTIPPALLWAGLTGIFAGPTHPVRRFLDPIMWTMVIVMIAGIGVFTIRFGQETTSGRIDVLNTMVADIWYGYLDTYKVPNMFEQQWQDALDTISDRHSQASPSQWRHYSDAWYLHGEFRWVVGLTVFRHAIAMAVVVAVIQLVRVVIGGLKE